MNFIAHYYLLDSHANHDMIFGNLLPDLLRGFTKIYNQEIKNKPHFAELCIVKGINFHLKTDEIFHNHAFFYENCEMIKGVFAQHKLPKNKDFIVAHVLLELIIDQFIIESKPAICESFYDSLTISKKDNLENKILQLFRQENYSKIFPIFKGFIANGYAYQLKNDSGILEALKHIVGNRIGSKFDDTGWAFAVQDIKTNLKLDIPEFLENIKDELHNA